MRATLRMQTARDLLSWLRDQKPGPVVDYLVRELEAATKPSPKKAAAKKARAKFKDSKRTTKREKTSAVYEAVAKRAGQKCECGCNRWFRGFEGAAQLDHFWGRAREESVESCWMLRADCHQAKTDYSPDRRHWLRKFYQHCKLHGYGAQAVKASIACDSEAVLEIGMEIGGGQ